MYSKKKVVAEEFLLFLNFVYFFVTNDHRIKSRYTQSKVIEICNFQMLEWYFTESKFTAV